MTVRDEELSILLHGGVFQGKAEELSSYILQYRKNFPNAEIVLSVSSSDFIDKQRSSFRKLSALTEGGERFCKIVNACVDKIVFCSDAFVLPPVKEGNANCNVNFLIESVQKGLDVINRKYVLRVRNDILFIDKRFIEEYERLASIRRGCYSCLSSRIMISSLFTLNPYGAERFPFHFSDWFHFGLLKDVKRLWNVEFVDIKFATYFCFNKPLLGSFAEERKFNFRLAVEQYIIFSFFKKIFPQLSLDVCNDLTSRDESIRILLDNFIVADMENINMYFPKYARDKYVLKNNNVCIMQDTWEHLAKHREENIGSYLYVPYGKHESFRIRKLPFRFKMHHFFSDVGFHCGDSIVVPMSSPNGPVTMGPFVTLPKGRYIARIVVSTFLGEEFPRIKFSAVASGWNIVLVSRVFVLGDCYQVKKKPYILSISFENKYEDLENFEIIVEKMSKFEMVIDSIEIDEKKTGNVDSQQSVLYGEYVNLDDFSLFKKDVLEKKDRGALEVLEDGTNFRAELINSFKFRTFKLFAGSFMSESLFNKLKDNPVRFILDSKSSIVKFLFRDFLERIG